MDELNGWDEPDGMGPLQAQLSLYVLCQLFMLVANGSLVKQVTLDLFGCGSSAGQTEAAAKAGGDSASNHETEAGISTVSDEAEEMESTGRWNRGKAEHRPRSPSPHPPRGLRYQRALLATLSEHGGSGNKLGAAAAVSVVRCAANNPVAAETLCAFKAWGGADAESGGGEMTETLEVECSAMAAEASENRGSRACGDPRAEQPDPASLAVAVPRRESLEGGREKGAGEGAQRLGDDGSVERWETSGERSLEAGEPTAESGGGGDDDRTESTIEDREGSLKRNVGVNVTRGAPAVLSFLSGRSQQPERVCCNGGGDEGGGASARRTRNEGFEQASGKRWHFSPPVTVLLMFWCVGEILQGNMCVVIKSGVVDPLGKPAPPAAEGQTLDEKKLPRGFHMVFSW